MSDRTVSSAYGYEKASPTFNFLFDTTLNVWRKATTEDFKSAVNVENLSLSGVYLNTDEIEGLAKSGNNFEILKANASTVGQVYKSFQADATYKGQAGEANTSIAALNTKKYINTSGNSYFYSRGYYGNDSESIQMVTGAQSAVGKYTKTHQITIKESGAVNNFVSFGATGDGSLARIYAVDTLGGQEYKVYESYLIGQGMFYREQFTQELVRVEVVSATKNIEISYKGSVE